MRKINTSINTNIYRDHKNLFELIDKIKNPNKITKRLSYNPDYNHCVIYIDKRTDTSNLENENPITDITIKYPSQKYKIPDIEFILSSNDPEIKISSFSFTRINFREFIDYIEFYKVEAMRMLIELKIALSVYN
jgi:hypothetical protein